jgi:uncharacterized protein YyaL (SSP411 family)
MREIVARYKFFLLGVLLSVVALWVLPSFSFGKSQSADRQSVSSPRPNTVAAFVVQELAAGKKPNHLINQKSPYLLQHAFNPVNWYPWGEEAFEKARREDKPIFLSIGYSTCHWCHVMARESFENPEIAAILNQNFVSIKVDREERPDLDRVYMTATQALTGGGGWPMSVFITHEFKPFYAGTYFPPEARYGKPGFPDLIKAIHQAWVADRVKILQSADKITAYLQELTVAPGSKESLTENLLTDAYALTAVGYDSTHGGFGSAPKFPRPVTFNFLLRYYHRSGEQKAREMALTTLRKMAEGGIRDHIGGGFHRYSVDGQWRVPHFEKMLYDQAQLAVSYLEAYQITEDPFYARVAEGIFDYILRDMTSPQGGFYSAEDADSSLPEDPETHGEGAFYLFTKKEIMETLGSKTGEIFSYHYGVQKGGNAPFDPQNEFAGKNILYVSHSIKETASHFGKSEAEISKHLTEARQRLFFQRTKRPRPHLDDKVITSWNGLMISGFARGYQVLGQPRYLEAADHAASFITTKLYEPSKKVLFRRYRDTAAGLEAHLVDYAFLVRGLLDLYEASLQIRWLVLAIDLTQRQIELFWDPRGGGFYDTSGNDKAVLLRMKDNYDGAEPSGNSIAAHNLLRLAYMIDNQEWHRKGAKTITTFAESLQKHPTMMPQLLVALDFQLANAKQIIIAGKPTAEDTQAMVKVVHKRFLPNKIILLADGDKGQKELSRFLPFMEGVRMFDGKATAYVCEDYTCKLPTTDVKVMASQLEEERPSPQELGSDTERPEFRTPVRN